MAPARRRQPVLRGRHPDSALGLGANTAVFTLIDAVMLRSLPVERPQELYSPR